MPEPVLAPINETGDQPVTQNEFESTMAAIKQDLDQTATKADLAELGHELRGEMATTNAELAKLRQTTEMLQRNSERVLDLIEALQAEFRFALAFLALLQVTAAILNSLPVPGLDGYGVIEPWLSYKVKQQVEPFAPFGLLFVFAVLFIRPVNAAFFDVIDTVLRGLGIAEVETYCGQSLYRFWQGTNEFCSAVS
jgi:hypothetical protein